MKFRMLPQRLLLPRYLLRTHIGPFIFSICTLMFLFVLQFVMKYIDQLVGKGLTAWVIIELVALNLAWMVVLAVPMSVLVATLMAFGELSSTNEITAMKASGISIYRMMAPVLLAAGMIAVLLVLFNNHVLPDANHRARTLATDIRRKKPTLTLIPGSFSQDIPGYSIIVHKTFEKTNDLEGITLYDYTNPNINVVVTAEKGVISFSPDYRKLIMDLRQGEIHELDLQKVSSYRRIRFQTHRIVMNVEGFDFERSSEGAFTRGDRELSANVMLVLVDSLQREKEKIERELQDTLTHHMDRTLNGNADPATAFIPPNQSPSTVALGNALRIGSFVTSDVQRLEYVDKQIDQYMVEVHKKYAIPAGCVVFVLVGLPLGVMARRGGFGIAATLSLGFFVLYWACLRGGEVLADRDITSPFTGMWIANILIGMMGLYLTYRIGRELVTIKWDSIQRLVPKRWRSALQAEQEQDSQTQ
jgi:lipopolysaccharide export system permease protein